MRTSPTTSSPRPRLRGRRQVPRRLLRSLPTSKNETTKSSTSADASHGSGRQRGVLDTTTSSVLPARRFLLTRRRRSWRGSRRRWTRINSPASRNTLKSMTVASARTTSSRTSSCPTVGGLER